MDQDILKEISNMVSKAANKTISDFKEKLIEQEPSFTDRLVANLQNEIDGKTIKGIEWKAKTLSDRGGGSQESIIGADFLGLLNIELKGLSVKKGFFAQAKLIRNGKIKDFKNLKKQCRKMLKITADSFVFLYSRKDIKVIPACSVVGTSSVGGLESLNSRKIERFFVDHLECFIGDPKLKSSNLDESIKVIEEFNCRGGLYIEASDRNINGSFISPITGTQTVKPTINPPEKPSPKQIKLSQRSKVQSQKHLRNRLYRND